ncbi:MAG TPA: hypothetical protein GX708_15250 [Gallicola sp.]|nr:hypothetical protein [Gallicola sp.]
MKELKVKIEVIASDGVTLEKKEQTVNINEYGADSIKKDRIFLEVGECLYVIDSDGYIKDQVFNVNSGQKAKYGLWGQ